MVITLIKRLWLGTAVILAASAVLLLSDLRSRKQPSASKRTKIALVKLVSNSLLDETENGILEELQLHAEELPGGITRFSAEGDIATANAISRQVTDGSYSMVISVSTLMLQSIAAANKDGKTVHVFAAVTDPAGAGVGIQRMDSTEKPPYLTGVGTFQPAEEIFRKAREFFPALKTVGTIWNPAESNSEACLKKARSVVGALGITLIEAPVEQARDIPEAAQSLAARGVQAFWAGCDATLNTGIDSLTAIAAAAHIPVFSNSGRHVLHGTLFDLGADYRLVGKEAARIVRAIAQGADPAGIPVRNYMPESIMLNFKTLKGLKDPWAFPPDTVQSAGLVVDESGQAKEKQAAASAARGREKPRLSLIYYSESTLAEDGIRGIKDGLARAGMIEGADYSLNVQSAQGDMATLNSIVDAAKGNNPDLYLVLSTPALQTVLQKVQETPIVFTVVADPFILGAGKSDEEHLPHVTGVYTVGPYAEMTELLVRCFPALKRVGTLFSPAEANSVYNKDFFAREAAARGLHVEAVAVNAPSEIPDAALALTGKNINALVQITDNLSAAGFSAIAQAARSAKLPLFGTNSGAIEQGAAVALSRDYYEAGLETAEKAVRVLRGESPAQIPFSPPRVVKTLVHPGNAAHCGLVIPPELLKEAAVAAETPAPAAGAPGKRWKIHLIELVENPAIDESREGVLAGLKAAGLIEGRDYELKVLNAQGDMATLNTLVDSALSDNSDMIYTITTPALQTAMQKVNDRPILFTLALDPLLIGDTGSHEQHRPNVAGVFDRSPFEAMAALIREVAPDAKRVGTLFAPAESNSVNFKEEFTKAAEAHGLELIAVPSSSPAEVSDAALALTQKGVDLICQINDNMHDAAFPIIVTAARRARLPLFSFSAGQASRGAAIALSNDHFDGGRESGLLAARVMRGEAPAGMPYRGISKTELFVNLPAAEGFGLFVPPQVLQRADKVIEQ